MKLVHMSDIHLTAPGKTIGGRDPRLNFERALTDILKCHHDAELAGHHRRSLGLGRPRRL